MLVYGQVSVYQDSLPTPPLVLLCRVAFQLVSLKGYWRMSSYSSRGAAYCISFSQTSPGSLLPISPVYCSAYEWQYSHLFCKSLLPLSHHLQTSCGCTLSYHPGKLYGPSINPCGASLMTGLQLVFVSVMTILWAQPFSWISVHLTAPLSRQTVLPQLVCKVVMETVSIVLSSSIQQSFHCIKATRLVKHFSFSPFHPSCPWKW